MERRRFKPAKPLDRCLVDQAERLRSEARDARPGFERDRLVRMTGQAETAEHLSEWLSSPGLQSPK